MTILPSSDGKCRVECHEQKGITHTVETDGEELKISVADSRKWYERIGINLGATSITIYLPEGAYRNVSVSVTTGNVSLENLTVSGDINLHTTTGNMTLKNVKCNSLTTNGTSGDAILKSVIAQGNFNIKHSTGDVKFNMCDASEICVETTTGSVTGTLLSDKIFVPETTTGDVHVPNTKQGGKCTIKTTTGDIEISIKK